MRIFVTGASGFVGGTATRHLVGQGHQVIAMSRSERSDAAIRAAGGEPVRCDLDTVTAAHMQGADAVIHAAAFVAAWGDEDAWYKSNVLGTRQVLDAARAAGVRRFVHIGTEGAIVHGQDVHGADETYPLALNSPLPYCATKAQSEQLVRDANAPGFETIVLRPRLIWGPEDTTLLPIFEAMVRSGKWVWIDGGRARSSTTHIANLIHGIELALEKGKPGSAYFILDDGDVSIREFITGMLAAKGVVPPEKSVPGWFARTMARACEFAWRHLKLRGEPPLTHHAAVIMSRDCTLIGTRARLELGYAPVISRSDGFAQLAQA